MVLGNRVRSKRTNRRSALIVTAAAATVLLAGPEAVLAGEFHEDLARVDEVLRKSPLHITGAALDSCRARRNFAVRLSQSGQTARAERSLKFCLELLDIPETRLSSEQAVKVAATPMQEAQARASREVDRALELEANIANGLAIYRECAACHMPEGRGLASGSVPQLAGQHRNVVIKQLADIRAGNRDNVLMAPYSSVESIGGSQAVADVAGYIDTLQISTGNGKGPGADLEIGERIFRESCVRCHGAMGEGRNDEFVPRIQAQHYNYLVRQFEWIRDGERRNANPEMMAQIQDFEDREIHAVLDYLSRLEPPPELQAPSGWSNPDFAN